MQLEAERYQEPEPPNTEEVEEGWSRGSTECTATERGESLYSYLFETGLIPGEWRKMEGKTVVDLGSGLTERFSRELKNGGVNANVIALNPDYSQRKFREIVQQQEDWQKKSVAALGQALPFRDKSIDYILGYNSLTIYARPDERPESAKKWALEIARVLKSGGEARLAPITQKEADDGLYKDMISLLTSMGLTAELRLVTNSREPRDKWRMYMIIRKPESEKIESP